MPIGCPKWNYYCSGDSNVIAIEEKLVLSTYFFSYTKEHFVIWGDIQYKRIKNVHTAVNSVLKKNEVYSSWALKPNAASGYGTSGI